MSLLDRSELPPLVASPFTPRVCFWIGFTIGLIPSVVLMAVMGYVLRHG